MIILSDDPVTRLASKLGVDAYRVFYLAAQESKMCNPWEIAYHRVVQYNRDGYDSLPDYIKEFCEAMEKAVPEHLMALTAGR